jgi:aspartate aminotransferase
VIDPSPSDARRWLDPRVSNLAPSPTLAERERANALCAEGVRVFRLELGQSPFPVPATVVDALRVHAAEKDYLPARGLPELRSAVAEYHRRRHGVARGERDVIVGPGSKELMFQLLYCFGAEILVPVPAWVSYVPQARLAGRQLRLLFPAARDGYRLRPAAIDLACRDEPSKPRLLVLNYPSNPTGCSYTPAELGELADVCRRHRVIVLADEIYGELEFHGAHHSLAALYEEGTILSGGLSKWCGAGGWRLGTFSFPPVLGWLAAAMAAMGSETYSSTSAPIQYAAVHAFRGGVEIEEYLGRVRRVTAGLLGWGAALLRDLGLVLPQPCAGFYLFVDFAPVRAKLAMRDVNSDAALAARLLRDIGVSSLPGRHFGMPEDSLHLRLALVDFDGAKALAAADPDVEIDEAFLRRHCGPTHEALCSIAAWLAAA